MSIPIVVMEWMPLWHYWDNKWDHYFPKETYGSVILDTHIYEFKDTVEEAEKAFVYNEYWNLVGRLSNQVPTMLGEYTLRLNKTIPTDELQGWAQFIQDELHSKGTIGSMVWNWTCRQHKSWSMRGLSNLET